MRWQRGTSDNERYEFVKFVINDVQDTWTTQLPQDENVHHIQNLTGIEQEVRRAQERRPKQANALSVAMEASRLPGPRVGPFNGPAEVDRPGRR